MKTELKRLYRDPLRGRKFRERSWLTQPQKVVCSSFREFKQSLVSRGLPDSISLWVPQGQGLWFLF